MTMTLMPLDVVPASKGVCSSCTSLEHKPADKPENTKVDHPYTLRVLPIGYVLHVLPTECPVCRDDLGLHVWVDVDLDFNAVNCDRYDREFWWTK
jgi:hypothetical protein